MKKGLVYGALCALALAVPAAAEKIFVPVLGTNADGSGVATKVWVAGADGAERRVSTGAALIALEADSFDSVRTQLAGRGGVSEGAAFTAEETYQAGLEVPLGDLPRPRAIGALTVGAANVSDQTAFCKATLAARDGRFLGEVPFAVEPMSSVQKDAVAVAGSGRVGAVSVTCDQSFFPLAVATPVASGKAPIVAKGIGPNGSCTHYLTALQQPNGHFATFLDGDFHVATRANPKGILCLKAGQDLRIAKAVFQWDVTVGPWSSRNRSGIHNLGYFFLDRYRSGVIGNVNALGPNKNLLKVMQNVGMLRGTNTNGKAGYGLTIGQTYHVVYTYDATNKSATLVLQQGGQNVKSFSIKAQPGNNQTLVLRRFNPVGQVSSLEFGNYLNQHAPEEATVGWTYSNFKLDMIPK